MVFCEQKATENKVSKAMIHPPSHTHISTKSGRHKRDREKEEVKKNTRTNGGHGQWKKECKSSIGSVTILKTLKY